ncbi:MAG: hypothetical protein FK734_20855 [Asgard group archaeon]|nr:hypothetical protein [Asgard group archaeon]
MLTPNIKFLIFCSVCLITAYGCQENKFNPKQSTFIRIDHYHSKYVDTVDTYHYVLYERRNLDTLSIYYFVIDTFCTAIYDEDWNIEYGDTTMRIDTIKVGWVLVNTPFRGRSPYGPFHIIDKAVYTLGRENQQVTAFCIIASNTDDVDDIIFYNSELGMLALYSLNWGNLVLLQDLNDRKLNQKLNKLLPLLINDTAFFPIPQKVNDFYYSN